MRLLDGERLLHTSKANAVIVPSDYGLSRFAADDLLPLVGLAGREGLYSWSASSTSKNLDKEEASGAPRQTSVVSRNRRAEG